MNFEFEALRVGASVVIVVVRGEVDMATAPSLATHLERALEDPGTRGVGCDLAGVGFLDSTGIGALVHARNLAEQRSKRFCVFGARGHVRQTLQLAAVSEFLHHHDDLEAATAFLDRREK